MDKYTYWFWGRRSLLSSWYSEHFPAGKGSVPSNLHHVSHLTPESRGRGLYVNFPLTFMAIYFDTVANYIRGVCQIIRQPFFVPCWPHRHQTLFLVLSFLYQCLCIRYLFYIQKVDECKCVWKNVGRKKQNLRIYRFFKTCLLVQINVRKTKRALFEGFT